MGLTPTVASFESYTNLAYIRIRSEGFTENGGVAALTGEDQPSDTTFTPTTIELRASNDFPPVRSMRRLKAMWARRRILWRGLARDAPRLAAGIADTRTFPSGPTYLQYTGIQIQRQIRYSALMVGTVRRRAGFHEYVDTEAMFMRVFDDLKTRKIIP
jgi:hypothetical protein